ncbi:MAG: hypothetical protein L0332_12370 [Chloroflexi bacterium]|nr:hypothetical protein [Chloroflexota bacterium]MCI0574878.1 hypothetical protein [Chloroflexota bacterium]MCI0648380.1 hypothetical protein [Chloroflexota bacterium]MCI0727501.1 hypothetical protein [Chloroflexota bacterium]
MKKQVWFDLLLVSIVILGLALLMDRGSIGAQATSGPNSGDVVARVYYQEIADIERLAEYDVWEYNNLREKYVLVALNEEQYQELVEAGWRLEIDVAATEEMHNVDLLRTFNGGYRTSDELYAELATINAANPGLTEIIDYGDSYCKGIGGCTTPAGHSLPGYDLRAMRVTNEAIGGDKPVFVLMANIHAREITTPELAMRFLDWLIDGYGVNADATWLVDWHEIYIVPTANPDGHWIVELGPYYQRKNANRSNGCSNYWPPTSSTQYGIDLNRNHTFEWNTGGSSSDPCTQTYRGPSAGSEPEVAQLQNFVLTLIPDQRGPNKTDPAPDNTTGIFITLHSYGELVLWPWGNTTTAAPNMTGLQDIGDKFATYNGYQSCQPSLCLYSTSGTSDDWVYGVLGAPAFTFEVGAAFMPTYSTIDSVQWPENRPAFIYAAKIARTPYMTARGPDALNIVAGPTGSNSVNVTATINDSANGGQAVASAVYYIDTPPWAGGALTGNLNASDGSFNSPVEGVSATIDTSGLSPGQHTLFIRGQDNAGNWGPFSAVFFDPAAPPPVSELVYASSSTSGTAGGVSFADEDILIYDTGTGIWSMFFDGSDVGLSSTDVDAFELMGDGSLLLSLDSSTFSVSGLGTVEDRDIIKFTPTSTGSTTAGSFTWFFDGSDVGLTTSSEDIDAIEYTADGKVIVSTLGSFGVTGASGNDEDLIIFTPTSLGATTSGAWAMHFDGSDVGLSTNSNEDVVGVWKDDPNGEIYLTTLGAFAVSGVSGDGADIFICTPGSLGSTTSCIFRMYWDGSANGFAGEVLDAFSVVK